MLYGSRPIAKSVRSSGDAASSKGMVRSVYNYIASRTLWPRLRHAHPGRATQRRQGAFGLPQAPSLNNILGTGLERGALA